MERGAQNAVALDRLPPCVLKGVKVELGAQ